MALLYAKWIYSRSGFDLAAAFKATDGKVSLYKPVGIGSL